MYVPLTKEELEIAKSNGISPQLARGRYNNFWDRTKAITMPPSPRGKSGWRQVREIAKANGISYELFYNRRKQGHSIKYASTTPIKTQEEVLICLEEARLKKKLSYHEQCSPNELQEDQQ